MGIEAFRPDQSATVNISASASSQRVALPVAAGSDSVRIVSDCSDIVFVEFGGAAVDATAAQSMPVKEGVTEVLDLPEEFDGWVAVIGLGNVGVIYFTPGTGA